MKKILTITTLTLLITGCETAGQAYNMSNKGTAAFSCTQITEAFNAYKRDRQSAQALAVLVPLVSANPNSVTQKAATTSDTYYQQAKNSANIALAVQGCPAIK